MPPNRRPRRPVLVGLAFAAMALSMVVLFDPGLPPQIARGLDLALLGCLAVMVLSLRRR